MKDNVIQEFMESIKTDPEKKQQVYSAIVSRIDPEGTIWVFVAGSNKETPTASTSASVKSGDVVNVMWQNNKLYIAGNYTDPSSGITRVRQVEQAANTAREAANNAVADAGRARAAAEEAETTANSVRGIAVDAQTNAGIAKTAADKAVKDLSQVENVVGVVNWIAEHGTMTSQAGETFDSSKVYFVVDPDGDYHIGSTHYSVVQNPVAEDIDSYYLLSIDESVQNYVTTHLYVDSEGLWLIPEENATAQTSSKKILVAVGGAGHTYETAGTHIIEKMSGVDKVIAKFIADGAQIGQDGETHAEIDYHSLQLISKEGDPYFHVSDLRDKDDNYQATITETYYGNGSKTEFYVNLPVERGGAATDSSDSSNIGIWRTGIGQKYVEFPNPPAKGATVTIVYKTTSEKAKAYTLGRRNGDVLGAMSVVEGWNNSARGAYSHAEGYECSANGMYAHAEGISSHASGEASHAEGGYNTFADGIYSHAEGENSIASGYASHAEGMSSAIGDYSHAHNYSIATKRGQTTLGTNNIEDDATTTTHPSGNADHGKYAVIVGNGIDSNNRSNAFTIDWRGNTEASGDITDGNGNVLSDKADSTDLANYLPLTGGTLTGALTENDVINSKNNNFERDTGGTLNDGFRIVDKNGDVVAYMKGISTLDSQDRTIEGFNIGTSRTVNGSDKWNSLRMMIDADGDPVVALNQVDAWLKALGLYEPTTPTISISATTGTVASYTVKKYGKVVSLSLMLQKSSATNAGANFFAGKIDTTGLRPLGYATSVGYYGSNSFVGNITPAGNITVRHTGTSQQAAVTGSTYVILGFTYLVE